LARELFCVLRERKTGKWELGGAGGSEKRKGIGFV